MVRPGENPPVPAAAFDARKIMVYDENGKKLVSEVAIEQIDQTATGHYSTQLTPGTYLVDINRLGIDSSGYVPKLLR